MNVMYKTILTGVFLATALIIMPHFGTQSAYDENALPLLYAAEKPAENPASKPPADTNNKPAADPNAKPTNSEEDDGGCKC